MMMNYVVGPDNVMRTEPIGVYDSATKKYTPYEREVVWLGNSTLVPPDWAKPGFWLGDGEVDPQNALECKLNIDIKIDQKSFKKSVCQEGGCAAYLTKDGKPLVTGRMCNLCHGHRSHDTCEACEVDSIGHSIFYFLMGITFVFGFFLLADMLFRSLPSLSIVYPGFPRVCKCVRARYPISHTHVHARVVHTKHVYIACKHKCSFAGLQVCFSAN